MFAIEKYHKAATVQETVELLSQNSEAHLLAGGTDVLVKLREGHEQFKQLIDIHDVQELQSIEMLDDGTLSIGAGVSCTRLIRSEIVQAHIPVLAQAANMLGGPQVRNAATLGGNICNGAPSAENASPLVVLDAQVNIVGPNGSRLVPITEFYLRPGKVDLEQNEIVTDFRIAKESYENTGGEFCKYAMRNAMDIATIGCSVICRMDEDRIEDLHIAYTVAAPVPTRCRTAEEMCKGQVPSKALLNDLAKVVHEDLKPRDSWRASKDFRVHVISTLAERVTEKAIIRAGGIIA
ncbi:xanthine dehydrogenase FAD-binding subunit XdhB [Sansalvadorimonas sp. 2012CJ34-2]|uniref:Xanthine dehydrogenase FAD-binding subunit XdhB n=1 Tax=Parendozoicomonas callyspongiae TaxID=2942213 RepID=A0ABT0PGJ4_9GAMM|nr:xanthine dehydrogenase subunit XdhB [Sansalvadorimonas sp. 2012CJ34-2]MCL6270489.1 xanthine dehydrogenase FAD-binding subunit XdhB [Sansalvadorimonas sp. 2012CJ34-2]